MRASTGSHVERPEPEQGSPVALRLYTARRIKTTPRLAAVPAAAPIAVVKSAAQVVVRLPAQDTHHNTRCQHGGGSLR